jgi:hypothetical protein
LKILAIEEKRDRQEKLTPLAAGAWDSRYCSIKNIFAIIAR